MTDMEMALMANIAVDMQDNKVDEVLDKIRAEIKEHQRTMMPVIPVQEVFEIIDKYKGISMLNEEVKKYRELSGDTNPNTPISRIGGYLDGYEKALEQEPKTGQYEKHIDHTDCLWYGSGDCPVTCSQYRDGWNDAMDYIFKNGKGYQPYRHDD